MVETVLLVAGSEKGIHVLSELLCAQGHPKISMAWNGGEARRLLLEGVFDLVIINTPLPDEFGHDLSVKITMSTSSSCILLVKNEIAEALSAKVENDGVFVIAKHISKGLFYQAIKWISTSRNRMQRLRDDNLRLQKKVEEIRLVDRAKCALIQYCHFTEQQAHRHIEKQAMDLRLSRRDIAQDILKTYEE